MHSNNRQSIEEFASRHRADFDAHEPRPELWAALEAQLTTPAAAAPLPTLSLPAEKPRRSWVRRYGVAATLAALVCAAGAGRLLMPAPVVRTAPPVVAEPGRALADAPDAALYQGGASPAMLAAARQGGSADSQLIAAVRSMELYYTMQLDQRRSQLAQLHGKTSALTADWQHELASLDSSYRELKLELAHHPQPDAVVAAMNRNLQIRLDILDQQLHLGTAQPAPALLADTYVLADSRR